MAKLADSPTQTGSGIDSYIQLTQAVGQALDHIEPTADYGGVFPLGLWLTKEGAIVDRAPAGGGMRLTLMALTDNDVGGPMPPARRGRPRGSTSKAARGRRSAQPAS